MRLLVTPLFWSLGWLFVALATAGLFVPLVPTTPFLLLAAWCFDRSSPRLHAWLLRAPALGPLLRDWREHGAIALRAKLACTVLLVGFGLAAWWRGTAPAWALIAMTAVSAGSLTFIWTRPSRTRPWAPGVVSDANAARTGRAAPLAFQEPPGPSA